MIIERIKVRYLLLVVINLFVLNTFLINNLFSQNDDIKVLSDELTKSAQNYYNYSAKSKENFEVIVLGGVGSPGKYLIPMGTTLIDLISYAGKPLSDDIYDDIKIIRVKNLNDVNKANQEIINVSYKNLFSNENSNSYININPVLKSNDIIVFPMELERTFWDFVKDGLLILTPLLTLASLIISISRNN